MLDDQLPELAGTYTIDPDHSRIGFVARHAMVTKVRGSFDDFEGTVVIDSDNPEASSATITIQGASIDTRNAERDAHLRSNDFLDLQNHPEITFTSTEVNRVQEDTIRLTGDLTIKGTTRPVTIDFEFQGTATDPFGNRRVGFEGSSVINRKDFGVVWNAALETGGVMVSDRITLEFELSLVRQD